MLWRLIARGGERAGSGGLTAWVVLWLTLVLSPAGGAAEVDITDTTTRPVTETEADFRYRVAVLEHSGWRPETVGRAINEARAIFGQCRIVVDAETVYWLSAPDDFQELDEAEQARLLSAVRVKRPVAVFVNQTPAGDVAYSYLESAPVASRGTAWITRNSDEACAGRLLAHELGHILLDTDRHSSDPDNLMAHTCVHSNVSGFHTNTELNREQCERLRTVSGTPWSRVLNLTRGRWSEQNGGAASAPVQVQGQTMFKKAPIASHWMCSGLVYRTQDRLKYSRP